MTSRTSVMSTRGVTLMPVIRSSSAPEAEEEAMGILQSRVDAIEVWSELKPCGVRDGDARGSVGSVGSVESVGSVGSPGSPGLEQGQHLLAEGLRAGEAGLDDALEGVEERDGGQSHQDTDGRGDQRLAHLGHQARRDLTGAFVQGMKGPDDSDDGAQQSEEGRVGPQGPQKGQALLHAQLRDLDGAAHALLGGGAAVVEVL